MSLVPNTTCRRCHRQYPSFRGRCPYCGTKKTKEVRSAVPETDSVVRGTQASKNAAEGMNMQMLIGGVLLVALMVAAIASVSASVGRAAKDQQQVMQQMTQQMQTTPIPLPSATPTPMPSATPQITDVECRWGPQGAIDYIEIGYFGLNSGSSIDLHLTWFPQTVVATPEWSVDDESIMTIEPNESGSDCHCVLVGESGTETVLRITVNGREEQIRVLCQ